MADRRLSCPSAQPGCPDSVVFGIVEGTVDAPRMTPLAKPLAVSPEILALSGPVNPTEVFRFSAPCAECACKHFQEGECSLVGRIVRNLPMVSDRLRPCAIRPTCRWFAQEGRAACLRCPQIVTETYDASDEYREAAEPPSV